MTDIPSTCSNYRKGALLTISGYVLGIIWGTVFTCLIPQ